MTVAMFILLMTICSAVSSVLTEGVKKWFDNANKTYSSNLIAMFNAIVVGCGGTAIAYVLLGVAFTLPNILCLVLMAAAVWLGSMVGYDKVIQLIAQITTAQQAKVKMVAETEGQAVAEVEAEEPTEEEKVEE